METNQGIPGTGLGMNITKRLVDMMEGGISVESEAGKGAVFTIRLPQKECGGGKCGAEAAESLRNFSFSSISISKKAQIVYEYMPYGKVLVVDDVESNLYVAEGMLIPYGLHIETAKSGAEAIKKIKDGNVYDIVFMDHMMPVMDGIKATAIIRASGYKQPIVALTANAVSGRSEIFLSNGFDRFISKPIDSRELDLVLKELIRDKQPPEIPEAARREKAEIAVQPKKDMAELKRLFIIDAEDAVNVLEKIYTKAGGFNDRDIELYTVTVHGMKSTLGNIGETKLSEWAFDLEKAGEGRNFDVIADKTPVFIKELKSLIGKFRPKETSGAAAFRDDMLYLKEKLYELKAACETYNIRAAEAVLDDLKHKALPPETADAVNKISVCLLRSEFKEAVSIAQGMINTP
jgi:CheY-like chemotaxis protein